jgi:uncharacterized protein (TIGR02996 family)
MNEEEQALLLGIARDHDADLPRLVYADWLEDHGQEQYAEFIRLQCEIAKLEVGPRAAIDANVVLWRRQQELLDQHIAKLIPNSAILRDVGFLQRGARFHRGFLDDIELTFPNEEWLEAQIVVPSRVRTTRRFHSLHSLANHSKNIDRLTDLYILHDPDDTLDADVPPRLPEGIVLPRLKVLRIENAPYLPELRDWVVSGCPQLTDLHIPFHGMTDTDILQWLDVEMFGKLIRIDFVHNHIGDQGAIELADRFPRQNVLRSLDLRHNAITSVGQNALLSRFGSRVTLF